MHRSQSAEFGWKRRGRRRRPELIALEQRALPSSTLYLDFGDNFPAGGFEITDGQLGSDLASGGLSGPSLSYSSATLLRFLPTSQRVTFDYNGSGTVNAQDWIDLRAAVVSLVERYYEPFDVNVVLAPALDNSSSTAYFNGIRDALNSGPAVTGERDCWCFVTYATVASSGASVGGDGGFYGIASGRDIGGNNANDDSCLVCADIVFNNFPGVQADTALGYTTAHEPAHNFGLAHTSNVALSNSDLIVSSAGSTNRTNFDFFTRYPLTLAGSSSVVNNHDRYASNLVLGLRAGAPVYVTGTGEHDIITITRLTATTATVSVQAFTNATYTTPVAVPGSGGQTTYSYTLTFNATDGILIDGGFDNDRFVIDGTLGVPIRVRGMGSTDQMIVNGGGAATATYIADAAAPVGLDGNASYGGTIVIGSTTIQFSEFETASTIEISGVTTLTVQTPSAADVITVDTVTGGRFRVAGTSSSVAIVPVIADVTNLVVDTATNDGKSGGNDTVTVILAGVVVSGRQVTIDTGNGSDQVVVQSLAANTNLTINAGAGNDTIQIDSNGAAAGGTVDQILGPITVNGQGGADTLTLEDSSDTTADVVTIDATKVGFPGDTFFGTGGALTYSQIETLNLNTASAATGDTINLTPSADTAFNINGNAPTTSPGDRLTLDLNDAGTPVRTPSTGTSGVWTFANRQSVTYTSIEDQLVSATPAVIIGDGTAQRSRVEQLRVVFDHVITYAGAPTAAFTLERIVGGNPVGNVSFTVNTQTVGDHTEATITFTSDTTAGSLNDGRYRLTVLASQVLVSGVALSADTVTNFHRFFGDVNGDERVDIADFGQFSTTYNLIVGQPGYNGAFDYNGDGRIDIADFGQFAIRYFTTLP